MSTRGIGLGEHGTVGMNYPNFHSEFARLTGAIRVPKPGTQLRRTQSLLSERAWNPIFKQLLENDRSDIFPLVESLGQSRLLGQEENNRVVQTDAWRYLFQNDSSQTGRLYALPDDRWEVNDVASICPQVIEQLKAVTADSPLSELLTDVRH